MKKLFFGTAGIPVSAKGEGVLRGVEKVRELGLSAMELEFVRRINLTRGKAREVRLAAKNHSVVLTCHAPYYINLNSLEKEKITASKKRIVDSTIVAGTAGAWSVCFHPAYYMKLDKERVYQKVKMEIKDVVKQIRDSGFNIWVRPETTGKGSQFGDLDELLRLSQEVSGVLPCVDFSHLHARYNGCLKTYNDFKGVFEKIEKALGKDGLRKLHAHVSGINYGEKGERNHLNFEQADFKYKLLVKAFKEFKVRGVVISESPNIEGDALIMKKSYDSLI
jgi:deoxyribonuclease-4